jgi:hypothetical protein
MNSTEEQAFTFDIDNDYEQSMIYTEWRKNSSEIESWHHALAITGSIVSIFGIVGKSIVRIKKHQSC